MSKHRITLVIGLLVIILIGVIGYQIVQPKEVYVVPQETYESLIIQGEQSIATLFTRFNVQTTEEWAAYILNMQSISTSAYMEELEAVEFIESDYRIPYEIIGITAEIHPPDKSLLYKVDIRINDTLMVYLINCDNAQIVSVRKLK